MQGSVGTQEAASKRVTVPSTPAPTPVTVRVGFVPDPGDEPRLAVSPDPFFVKEGQVIRWEGHQPFTVRFERATPLCAKVEMRATGGPGSYEASATVRPDAARVELYKYSIAALGLDDQIHLLDPTGVVESDKTGKEK